MAARTRRLHPNQKHRDNIRTTMLIKRLTEHILGKIELTTSQVASIKILLGKALPDLKAMELTGEEGGDIKIITRVERVIVNATDTNS